MACKIIYCSTVLHNFLQVHDSVQWNELLLNANRLGRDPELATWFQTHERVFCDDCSRAHENYAGRRQVLYCVHTDKILEKDRLLAHSNKGHHSRGAGCDVNAGQRRRHTDRERAQCMREHIADDLWREFLVKHPHFNGNLTEMYLQHD